MSFYSTSCTLRDPWKPESAVPARCSLSCPRPDPLVRPRFGHPCPDGDPRPGHPRSASRRETPRAGLRRHLGDPGEGGLPVQSGRQRGRRETTAPMRGSASSGAVCCARSGARTCCWRMPSSRRSDSLGLVAEVATDPASPTFALLMVRNPNRYTPTPWASSTGNKGDDLRIQAWSSRAATTRASACGGRTEPRFPTNGASSTRRAPGRCASRC